MVYRTDFLPPYIYGAPGTTDRQGDVLVPESAHFDSLYLSIFDPAGVLLATPPAYGGSSFGIAAIGVDHGFIGVQNFDDETPTGFPAHRVAKVFPDGGTQQSEFDGGLASQGEDPRGGMIVLVSKSKTLTAYDSDLVSRWETQLPITNWDPSANRERLPVGVDTDGNSLVLFQKDPKDLKSAVLGVWTDASGHPGAAFNTGGSAAAFCLKFATSVTGGLFLQYLGCPENAGGQGEFVASFQSLDPHSSPAPDWLVQRPGADLRPIRGGTGYAAIGSRATGPLACSIEVLTPDGHSCGRVDFGPWISTSASLATGANAGTNPQPSCWLAVGSDGTVIALTEEMEPINGTNRWTWHWWPAFFR